jgi:predicted transcriptional regulator
MDLETVVTLLKGEVITRNSNLKQEVAFGAAADLMSDALTFARPDSLLLTGLMNPQVVRTAEVAGFRAIVFVRGKEPPAETVHLAEEIGMPLLRTRYSMYDACGRLYKGGLAGPGQCESYGVPEQQKA